MSFMLLGLKLVSLNRSFMTDLPKSAFCKEELHSESFDLLKQQFWLFRTKLSGTFLAAFQPFKQVKCWLICQFALDFVQGPKIHKILANQKCFSSASKRVNVHIAKFLSAVCWALQAWYPGLRNSDRKTAGPEPGKTYFQHLLIWRREEGEREKKRDTFQNKLDLGYSYSPHFSKRGSTCLPLSITSLVIYESVLNNSLWLFPCAGSHMDDINIPWAFSCRTCPSL